MARRDLDALPPEAEEQLDRTLDGIFDVNLNVVNILTGKNGSGKSLIRKQLSFRTKEKGYRLAAISMATRTQKNHDFGALSAMAIDPVDQPTSMWTVYLINQLWRDAESSSTPVFIVIDEPEIGMGEETVMALVAHLNTKLANKPANLKGVLVITHSRYVVSNLNHDNFVNIDGFKTKEEWLNRELVPTDLDKLEKNDLYFAILKRERDSNQEEKDKKRKEREEKAADKQGK